ncbi:MAG: hypothetical protein U1F77_15580 [Kiritimatiellia bacterium]
MDAHAPGDAADPGGGGGGGAPAGRRGPPAGRALFTSGYAGEGDDDPARLLDTPWCNGAVWSMNSMPGLPGDVTDYGFKWNATLRGQRYGRGRGGAGRGVH